jgi:succinyl-CoA synthetase beta subunit
LTGGRSKAGGVKKASTLQEAEDKAKDILSLSIKDMPVNKILVVKTVSITHEFYTSFTTDRNSKSVLCILSAAGGVDIEEVAETTPGKIIKFPVRIDEKVTPQFYENRIDQIFAEPEVRKQTAEILYKMFTLFKEKDCSLVEVNPLVLTSDDKVIAADAKIVIDDNAIIFHDELLKYKNPEEYSADEIDAKAAGLSFVSLEGEIGCMVNGAGLAMATMDLIKLAGGQPANFLDVGGSSNPQKVLEALRIITRNKNLKAILINIFGGITRCDDIANGIIIAKEKLNISVPMVIRLAGTNEKEGRILLAQRNIIAKDSMSEAVNEVVQLAKVV